MGGEYPRVEMMCSPNGQMGQCSTCRLSLDHQRLSANQKSLHADVIEPLAELLPSPFREYS